MAVISYSKALPADRNAAIVRVPPARDYRCSAVGRWSSSRQFLRSLPCSLRRKSVAWDVRRLEPSWRTMSSERISSAMSTCRARAPSWGDVVRDVSLQPDVNLEFISLERIFMKCKEKSVNGKSTAIFPASNSHPQHPSLARNMSAFWCIVQVSYANRWWEMMDYRWDGWECVSIPVRCQSAWTEREVEVMWVRVLAGSPIRLSFFPRCRKQLLCHRLRHERMWRVRDDRRVCEPPRPCWDPKQLDCSLLSLRWLDFYWWLIRRPWARLPSDRREPVCLCKREKVCEIYENLRQPTVRPSIMMMTFFSVSL